MANHVPNVRSISSCFVRPEVDFANESEIFLASRRVTIIKATTDWDIQIHDSDRRKEIN